MKLNADRLEGALKRGLAPAYFITGDEPLLVGEACDAIRTAARALGHETREVNFAERGFDWDSLAASGASLSLFSDKRIVELTLPSGKPGVTGAKTIVEYVENLDPDTLLLVIAPKLDKRSLSTAWVKAIDKIGAVVQIWPVEGARLKQWIAGRMRAKSIQASDEAVALLADRVHGNLLAANQEIEKLLLLNGPGTVDVEDIARSVADSARYDVYQLSDAALVGDTARALRVLDGLHAEGVEPVLVLWSLARDIRTLATIVFAVSSGASYDAALAKARVWSSRKALFSRAARRVGDAAAARALLALAAESDAVVKGAAYGRPWDRLTGLVAHLAAQPVAQRRAG